MTIGASSGWRKENDTNLDPGAIDDATGNEKIDPPVPLALPLLLSQRTFELEFNGLNEANVVITANAGVGESATIIAVAAGNIAFKQFDIMTTFQLPRSAIGTAQRIA